MKRIAIVGGGIAGLTAAYELSQQARNGAGIEVVLFESSNRLRRHHRNRPRRRHHHRVRPRRLGHRKTWAKALAEELGLADEIISSNDATRKTYVLLDGHLHSMPSGMRMMVPTDLTALDNSELFDMTKQTFHAEITRADELKNTAPHHDESVADFVRRHFGSEVLGKNWCSLLSGVFGGDVEKLSVRAVMAPFVAMEKEQGSGQSLTIEAIDDRFDLHHLTQRPRNPHRSHDHFLHSTRMDSSRRRSRLSPTATKVGSSAQPRKSSASTPSLSQRRSAQLAHYSIHR